MFDEFFDNFVQCVLIIFKSSCFPSLPAQFVFSLFFRLSSLRMIGAVHTPLNVCSLEHDQSTRGWHLQEKWTLFQQQSISTFSARHATSSSSPFSTLGFHLAWACTSLMNAVSIGVNLFSKLPVSKKTLFPFVIDHFWLLFSFYLLLQWLLRLGGKGYGMDVLFRAEHSAVSCFLHLDGLGVCVLIIIYRQKKLLWWGFGDALIYGWTDKVLEVCLIQLFQKCA